MSESQEKRVFNGLNCESKFSALFDKMIKLEDSLRCTDDQVARFGEDLDDTMIQVVDNSEAIDELDDALIELDNRIEVLEVVEKPTRVKSEDSIIKKYSVTPPLLEKEIIEFKFTNTELEFLIDLFTTYKNNIYCGNSTMAGWVADMCKQLNNAYYDYLRHTELKQ